VRSEERAHERRGQALPQKRPGGERGKQSERVSRATYRDVFAVAEFRALWLAQVLSVGGDQLARVALTVLVYDRTRSSLLAAVTFVCSLFPTFLGGLTLSGLADRLPRRTVMIACDVIRAALVLVMVVPGTPLAVLIVLLFLVTLVGAPFQSARSAIVPDVLPGEAYVLGTAVTITTLLLAQFVGFAVGGAVVGAFGVRTSLVVDAATYVASALLVRWWVRKRPAARSTAHPAAKVRGGGLAAGVRLVLGNPALRTPMLFGWLAAFYDAPEGVAAPLAHALRGGSKTVGLLLAAGALGAGLGAVSFSRLVSPARRMRWTPPLAIACCAALILLALRPPLAVTLLVLLLSGLLSCYQTGANAAFVTAVPPEQRGQAFGLAQGGINLGQGVVMILAGAAAGRFAPAIVIAVIGALGVLAATAVTLAFPRH
jgi:predicted MFS family arabinose efflux permease